MLEMKEVTPEIIRAWVSMYSIDVQLELCKMDLWMAKNPAYAAKLKLPLRFAERWLKKATKDARRLASVTSIKQPLTERELINLGRQKGLEPRPGESREAYERRVRA